MLVIKKIIKLLGGIPKDEVLTEAVKHLFNTIGEDDILKIEGSIWMVGNKPLIEGKKKLLISEAGIFLKTELWKVLKRDIQYRANQAMFEKAKSEQDLIAGKLWLYTLDCIESRLKSLK